MESTEKINQRLAEVEYSEKSELVNGKDKRNFRRKIERKQKGKRKYGF